MELMFFNRACVYDLLDAVRNNPGTTPYALIHDDELEGSSRTKFTRLHELTERGFISRVKKKGERWNSHGVYLTETGEKALGLLDELKKMENIEKE